jgi:hypothetical protein
VKLRDIARLPLSKLSNALTWQSHGMSSREFINWMMGQKKEVDSHTEMAVYFYERV